MPDRWVSAPHVHPYTCHRCGTSDPNKGPFLYKDWQYMDPRTGQDCRFFCCSACWLADAQLEGAPVPSLNLRIKELELALGQAQARVQLLESREPVLKVVSVEEVKTELKPKPAAKRKPAPKKKSAAA